MKKKGQKMIQQYQKDFAEHGVSPASLGYAKEKQHLRFQQVRKYLPKNDATVLDFGCGFGDLSKYLSSENIQIEYTGCDVMQEFLEVAKVKNPGNYINVEFGQPPKGEYDYVVCLGVFNFLYVPDPQEHFNIVCNTLLQLFSISTKGLIVDFQSEFVDYKSSNAYHQNISDLAIFAKNKLSRRFIADYSYLPFEYMFVVMKDSEINKNHNIFLNN